MNKLKVTKLIKSIREYIWDLKEYLPLDEKKLKNKKRKYLVSFLVQQIANECISLGNHIISSFNLEIPSTSVEIFDILAKHKFITEKVGEKMKNLVRTRNIIAHRYITLDLNQLAERANEIEIADKFIKQLLNRVKKEM